VLPIVYDSDALNDLAQQFDYIFDQSGEKRAVDFVDRIEVFIENLGIFPELGRVVTRVPVVIRAIAFRRQAFVVYAPEADRIVILRVFNRGQDVDLWLGGLLDDNND
jgi:toxin ParE1/3/4